MKITLRQLVVLVLATIGYGVALAMIGKLPSFVMRVLVAGVVGGLQGIAFMYAFRRSKPL
jgi:hypothetical protein